MIGDTQHVKHDISFNCLFGSFMSVLVLVLLSTHIEKLRMDSCNNKKTFALIVMFLAFRNNFFVMFSSLQSKVATAAPSLWRGRRGGLHLSF